jgi:hypothetical protein
MEMYGELEVYIYALTGVSCGRILKYPLCRRLSGSQSQFDEGGEERN